MKRYLLFFLLLLPLVNAAEIRISVNNFFTAEFLYFDYNDTLALKVFTGEIVNSGSLAYEMQARVDVFDENGSIFTGWSPIKRLAPGNNGFFKIYWVPETEGMYLARLRVYYTGELLEKLINITVTKKQATDALEITSVETFDNHVIVMVNGPADAGKIAVVPADYPPGWILQQAVGKGRLLLGYRAYLPGSQEITINLASINGLYTGKKEVLLQPKSGLDAKIRNMVFGALRSF